MKKTTIPSIKPKTTRSIACATLLLIPFLDSSSSLLLAQPGIEQTENKANKPNAVEVEVKRIAIRKPADKNTDSKHKGKEVFMKANLSYVTYNKDRSLFVGYYQDGWSEMVSLHDAKTKKQLGSVYCDGGVPTVFRFSKDGNFLGAKASVGWYVWKIPKFEKVFILGDIDFDRPIKAERGGARQPATAEKLEPARKEKIKFVGTYEWNRNLQGLGFETGRLEIKPGGAARFYVGKVKFPDEIWTIGKKGHLRILNSDGETSIYSANPDGSITKDATELKGKRTDIPKALRQTYKKLK